MKLDLAGNITNTRYKRRPKTLPRKSLILVSHFKRTSHMRYVSVLFDNRHCSIIWNAFSNKFIHEYNASKKSEKNIYFLNLL